MKSETRYNSQCALHCDSNLLTRFIQNRDEESFRVIVARHGPMVMAVCRGILRREQDSEDAFQATFLVLATRASKIRRRSALASWLHRTAYHISLKASASIQLRMESQIEEATLIVDDSLSRIADQHTSDVLHEELNGLPEEYRKVLVTCYLEGMSREEAARQLGCSVGVIKGRLERGRQRLRSRLLARGVTTAVLICASASGVMASEPLAESLIVSTVKGSIAHSGGNAAACGFSPNVFAITGGGSVIMSASISTRMLAASILTASILIALVSLSLRSSTATADQARHPTLDATAFARQRAQRVEFVHVQAPRAKVASAPDAKKPDTVDLAKTRKRVKAVIDSVNPAIVRFAYGKKPKLRFGCGVLVSPSGHVVISGPVHAVLDNKLLELQMADGRRVRGKALGWSSEFGFGMLKITESGKWPHVKLGKRAAAGQVCLALGYSRNPTRKVKRPRVRLGIVTKVSQSQWLTTSYRSQFNAHPVFSLDGKLLGLNCSTTIGRDPLHVSAALIEAHWKDLTAGKNLDRLRLFLKRPKQSGAADRRKKVSAKVIVRAKGASVRISDVGAKKSLASGVIVTSDGYVVTCGHHWRMPGKRMTLTMHDGRTATAVVLGTNLVADVGVLKITDKGKWPYTKMGRSTEMKFGDHCVLIGYPTKTKGPEPWVFASRSIKPTQTLRRRDDWYDEFWTSGFPRSIGGASGGGVFDVHGHVIGVLRGGVGKEMQHARIELFRKNWEALTSKKAVDIADRNQHTKSIAMLNRLALEFSIKRKP